MFCNFTSRWDRQGHDRQGCLAQAFCFVCGQGFLHSAARGRYLPMLQIPATSVLLAEHLHGLSCLQECPGRLALLLGSIYLFLVGFFTPGCSFTGLLLGSLYGLPAAFCAIATLSTLGAAINYCLSALLIKVTWRGAHRRCRCVSQQTLPGHAVPGCRPVTLCWGSSVAV